MKKINNIKISTLLILFITLLIVGCSKGPSEDVIKKVVTEYWTDFNKKIPLWLNYPKDFKNVKNSPVKVLSIDRIEIKEKSKISEDGRKQHVLIVVSGMVSTTRLHQVVPGYSIPSQDMPNEQFTSTDEYLFKKDDYGDWYIDQKYDNDK